MIPAPAAGKLDEAALEAAARALWEQERKRAELAGSVISRAAGKTITDAIEPFEENRDIWLEDARAAIASFLTAAPAPEAGGDELIRRLRAWHSHGETITGDVQLYLDAADEIERLRASPSAGAEAMREALEPFAYIGAALEQAGKESWPDGASAKYMALEGLFARDFRHAHAVFSALPTAPTESQSSQAAAISLQDPMVILAGIKQFGLAPDGSDLRDLEAVINRLHLDALTGEEK